MIWEGEERRVSNEEHLGYIEARVESVQAELKELKDTHKEHCKKEESMQLRLESKLDDLVESQRLTLVEITVYKRIFKILVASGIAVLTLSFGDLAKIFKGLL